MAREAGVAASVADYRKDRENVTEWLIFMLHRNKKRLTFPAARQSRGTLLPR